MAFVPGAKNDVFISYAHFDNEGGATGERWVTDFVQRLESALRERLGCPVDIYFDSHSLEGHQVLSEILDNVRRSAVFVPILSPSYINRKWTQDELDAFMAMETASRIVFTVERLPLESENEYPQTLRERKRSQFWYRGEDSGVPYIMTPSVRPDRYFGAITDVVDHMARQLRTLKAGGGLGAAAPGPAKSSGIEVKPEGPAVLLAQVTEDIDDQRDQVRRHLEQFGIPVLPASLYPQGGADFQKAFEADLGQAALFVQLLGPVPGRKPPDLSQGYAQFQFDAARARGIPMMTWRRPDLDLSSIAAPHAALVGAPTVQAMSLQAFKSEIVRKIQTPPPPPPPSKAGEAKSASTVFINAVREDGDLAAKLQEEFAGEGCMAMLPMWEGPPEAISTDLNENIIDCDALVLVYGAAESSWVRGQLKLYNKLKPKRADPRCLVVICNAPPGPKAPIGIMLPEAQEIEFARMLEAGPFAELLSRARH